MANFNTVTERLPVFVWRRRMLLLQYCLFIDCLILWRIVQQMFMVSEELLEISEAWELTYWETQEKSVDINLCRNIRRAQFCTICKNYKSRKLVLEALNVAESNEFQVCWRDKARKIHIRNQAFSFNNMCYWYWTSLLDARVDFSCTLFSSKLHVFLNNKYQLKEKL